jgi:hypothetical protein
MEGPLIGGTGLLAMVGTLSGAGGRASSGAAEALCGGVDDGDGELELADRLVSSNVPHIPQKRKLSELSSPHLGQITVSLRMSLPYSLTLRAVLIAHICSY